MIGLCSWKANKLVVLVKLEIRLLELGVREEEVGKRWNASGLLCTWASAAEGSMLVLPFAWVDVNRKRKFGEFRLGV